MADNTLLDFQQKISATLEVAIKSVTEASESTDPVAKTIAPTLAALLAVVQLQQQCLSFFLQQHSTNSNSDQQMQPQPQIENSADSAEEKERKRSVVVAGLKESEGAPSSRAESDKKQITNLLDEIDVEGTIVSCYRLGQKKEGRHRLLKVVLATTSQQRNLISNARKLKTSTQFPRTFVRPSLTPDQQQREFQLRQELRGLRKDGKKALITGGRPGDKTRKIEVLN